MCRCFGHPQALPAVEHRWRHAVGRGLRAAQLWLRGPGERANAQLKSWRVLRKIRSCPREPPAWSRPCWSSSWLADAKWNEFIEVPRQVWSRFATGRSWSVMSLSLCVSGGGSGGGRRRPVRGSSRRDVVCGQPGRQLDSGSSVSPGFRVRLCRSSVTSNPYQCVITRTKSHGYDLALRRLGGASRRAA
jgi:hypothetical protein